MPSYIEASVKNRSTSLAETVIFTADNDWAGTIDYHTTVKNTSVATLGIVFRWKDRNGASRSHSVLGLSLLTVGPLLAGSDSFNLWSQDTTSSTITLELIVTGLTGSGSFDFFCNGAGLSYGS